QRRLSRAHVERRVRSRGAREAALSDAHIDTRRLTGFRIRRKRPALACPRRAAPGLGRIVDSRAKPFDKEAAMLAVIGNVLIGFLAVSLFTATIRLSK